MSKTKATEAALFIGENEEILFLAFLGRLFGLCRWSFLLVWCRIELVCDEDDAVVLGALLINPLVWLEVALDGETRFPSAACRKNQHARSCAMPPCS